MYGSARQWSSSQPIASTSPGGTGYNGPFDVAIVRRRIWAPAIESAGIATPARIYDLCLTFISNALANGLTVFETARVAGISGRLRFDPAASCL